MQKLTIEQAQEIALRKEGMCLSSTYINDREKLVWKCSKQHIFELTCGAVFRGNWCKFCKKIEKNTLVHNKICELASAKGGRCVSVNYAGAHEKLTFVCVNEHSFEMTPGDLRKDRWCKKCFLESQRPFRPKWTIEQMHEMAGDRGGRCLSKEYKGCQVKLLWECNKKHQFEMTPEYVRNRGCWCPGCKPDNFKLSRDQVNEFAEKRGGKFISEDYKGVMPNHIWECSAGHRWEATANSVFGGSWCPSCRISKAEEICRIYFETIFDKKFPPARPGWLKNKDNKGLYLDGYCEELKLAFEHQGIQHYKEIPFFKKASLEKIKQNDLEKKVCCHEHGVTLVIIPALFIFTKLADIKTMIKNQCSGIGLPFNFDEVEVDIENLYTIKSDGLINKCNLIATKKGGKCLSKVYINGKELLEWSCNKKHVWKASFNNVSQGSWCRLCRIKYDLNTCHKIAILNGGSCSNAEYTNYRTKLSLKCGLGHRWKTMAINLFDGCWCPVCKRPKYKNITAKELFDKEELTFKTETTPEHHVYE